MQATRTRVVHDGLRPISDIAIPAPDEIDEQVGEVEAILDARASDDTFLIKWHGSKEETWEPRANLLTCEELLAEFERFQKRQRTNETAPSMTDFKFPSPPPGTSVPSKQQASEAKEMVQAEKMLPIELNLVVWKPYEVSEDHSSDEQEEQSSHQPAQKTIHRLDETPVRANAASVPSVPIRKVPSKKNETRLKIKFPDGWMIEFSLAINSPMSLVFKQIFAMFESQFEDVNLYLLDTVPPRPKYLSQTTTTLKSCGLCPNGILLVQGEVMPTPEMLLRKHVQNAISLPPEVKAPSPPKTVDKKPKKKVTQPKSNIHGLKNTRAPPKRRAKRDVDYDSDDE